MASKRRIRRRSCTNKVRHETEAAANIARMNTPKRGGRNRIIYKCHYCGGYHIGTPNRRIKQAMKARRER